MVVRIGVENMVMMVNKAATPAVVTKRMTIFIVCMERYFVLNRISCQNHCTNLCQNDIAYLKKGLQAQNADNDDDEQEQTHNMASRFRNRASLFILATWTLGNHVAPEKVLKVKLMVMMIMLMTETHLIALIGKNLLLPVLLLMFM